MNNTSRIIVDSAAAADGGVPAANDFHPIFVVGCERSGTTLLAVLLDRHPELAMTPETCFFQKVVPRKWRSAGGDHEALLARFHNWYMSLDLGLDPESLRARFMRYTSSYAHLFRAVMEEYAHVRGKGRAGEKTPFHLWQVPLILEWFPEARIIGMMRDGRDVVLSILEMPWTSHRILRLHCLKWSRTVRTEVAFEKRYPGQFKMVRYEELLGDPEGMMREIDAFLGLEFAPGQLEAGGKSDVVVNRALGYKGDAMAAIDASRISGWKKKGTRGQLAVMNSMMGPVLRQMKYPDIDMTGHSWPARIGHAVADVSCRLGVHRFFYNLFLRKGVNLRREADEKEMAEASQSVWDSAGE